MKTYRCGIEENLFGSRYTIQRKTWFGWMTHITSDSRKRILNIARQLEKAGNIVIIY